MNRRWSDRLDTNMPVEYRVALHEQESQVSIPATVKNISQSGVYLECDSRPYFILGQVGYFKLKSIGYTKEFGCIHLAAKVIVHRIDHPAAGEVAFGFAVEFLSGPRVFFDNPCPVINEFV